MTPHNFNFHKYHGAGNDFIMVNQFNLKVPLNRQTIAFLCHRHLGIGADGLIVIEATPAHAFKMTYFNSDGNEGSMCGNGGRASMAFAFNEGLIGETASFLAFDGVHQGWVHSVKDSQFDIEITMIDVQQFDFEPQRLIVNTGSPHFVTIVNNLKAIDVVTNGRSIRNSESFRKEGINVNFLEINEGIAHLRTYERGVEDETLSCGTGVTAAAIAVALQTGKEAITINTLGGTLDVNLKKTDQGFTDIRLRGPVTSVFSGNISIA
jgi:diaminopimelate epimerase